jgi:hypothetical protein
MLDINNKEIQAEQFIRVTGCKVKNDNGIYIVDREYSERITKEFCLKKVLQNGELSETKYNIFFLEDRAYKKNPDLQVKIITKEELKQAAQEVKNYISGITAQEKIYTFVTAAEQEIKEGKYIKFVKSVLLRGHINRFSGTYEITCISKDGAVSLHLIGAKGEQIAYNVNGYYQFTPIILSFNKKVMDQLFAENYIKIMERQETTKGEVAKVTAEPKKAIEQPKETAAEQNTITEQQEEHTTVENKNITPIYYIINEKMAASSRQMWSMFDYKPNSKTEEYKAEVNRIYDLVKQIAEQKPEKIEKALLLAERFSRKYAEWINTGFNIDMMCPSVLISGAGNFPVRKKEKQNARHDKHWQYYNDYLKEIPKWIKDLLYDKEIIKSSDPDAIEQLTAKLEKLQKEREEIKEHNKKARSEGKPEQQTDSYVLQNLGQNIRSVEQRINSLSKAKTKPTTEYNSSVCTVVENTELMRIQLLFDSIPPVETRNILKSNGFKWSPTNKAWQRQLTDNARYATKKVLEQLEA